MERTITLSGIYAKFTKNFDAFGKMVTFFLIPGTLLDFQGRISTRKNLSFLRYLLFQLRRPLTSLESHHHFKDNQPNRD